ncbi:hypothetical protein [Paucihalobacter sp.]|uniref:hypothetical protein n=1 Tax=Paucihalobacter sp. TaxID=2850405 RepID=UPI002FE33B30
MEKQKKTMELKENTVLENKIREVLNVLKNLNTADADWILKQSSYNIKRASTLNNIENMELDVSGIK